MPDFDAYILCTAPRSGSTLLCKLLAATGVAGQPRSYLHTPSVADWAAAVGLRLHPSASQMAQIQAVMAEIIAQGRGDADLFDLRLQRHSFDFALARIREMTPDLTTDRARFEALFGRTAFLHLTRQDKVAQAVSYVKAEQSGLWHQAPDGTDVERLSPRAAPGYDAQAIQTQVDRLRQYDRDWQDWFAAERITPLILRYEALAEDPTGTVAQVLRHLGLDPDAAHGLSMPVRKLADAESQEWIDRFRATHPDTG